MTTPNGPSEGPSYKMVRLPAAVYERLAAVQGKLTPSASMADAVSILMDPSTVRISLNTGQRARWERAAEHAGMPLPEFVMARVEAALQYGADPVFLRDLRDHMETISRHFDGIRP